MAAYYSAIEKKEILMLRAEYMDPPGILLSEIKVKQKDTYCRILLVVESKNNNNKKRKKLLETRLVVAPRGG